MATKINTVYGAFFVETCCHDNCRTQFMMSEATHQVAQQRKEGFMFYCTHGHSQHYISNETALDKMRRERDRFAQQVANREDIIKEQEEENKKLFREKAALRGVVTKVKKRVGSGVCPCCNRHFSALSRHMKHMHPAYANEAA